MICDECRKNKYCSHDCRARKNEIEKEKQNIMNQLMFNAIEKSPILKEFFKFGGHYLQ